MGTFCEKVICADTLREEKRNEFIFEKGEFALEEVADSKMASHGVLLDKDALASNVSVEEFAQGTRYVDVAFLRDGKNHSLLEDKMLRVFVLSCSHGERVQRQEMCCFGGSIRTKQKGKVY
jgi:hypothetical protein